MSMAISIKLKIDAYIYLKNILTIKQTVVSFLFHNGGNK